MLLRQLKNFDRFDENALFSEKKKKKENKLRNMINLEKIRISFFRECGNQHDTQLPLRNFLF